MSVPKSVTEFLQQRGRPFEVFAHAEAFTAQEAAAAAHVRGREWVKTVVCFADGQPILAALPAHYSIDLDRLRDLAGADTLRMAAEDEMVPLYPDCERGAVPPLGPLFRQKVFVDLSLTADPEVVFHGGSHVDAVRMRYADFVKVAEPVVGQFAVKPGFQ